MSALGSLASLLGIGVNLYSQNAANALNASVANSSNAMQRQIARENNQAMVDLWREQTRYNSPANMRLLYENAGFNPNLISGSLVGSAGSPPSMVNPAPNAVPHSNPYMVDPLTLSQIANIDAQTEKTKAETLKVDQDIQESESRIKVNQNSILISDREISLKEQLQPYQIDAIQASIDNTVQQTNNLVQECENLKKNFDLLDEQHKQSLIRTAIAQATKDSEIARIMRENDISEKQLELMTQQLLWNPKLWQSQIALHNAQAKVADFQANDIILKLDEWLSDDAKNARKAEYFSTFYMKGSDIPAGALDALLIHVLKRLAILF